MSMEITKELLISLRKIAKEIDLYSQLLIKEYGITGTQLLIIKEIAISESIAPAELARKMSISQATVSTMLDRLVLKGLISRQKDSRDRRKQHLHLEEKALEILKKNPSLLHHEFIAKFERLKPWEQTQLLSSLQRVSELMQVIPSKDINQDFIDITII